MIWNSEDNAPFLIINNYLEGANQIHPKYHIKSMSVDNYEIDLELLLLDQHYTQPTLLTRKNIPISYAYIPCFAVSQMHMR